MRITAFLVVFVLLELAPASYWALLLRAFAEFCGLLRAFAGFCVILRNFAGFCALNSKL